MCKIIIFLHHHCALICCQLVRIERPWWIKEIKKEKDCGEKKGNLDKNGQRFKSNRTWLSVPNSRQELQWNDPYQLLVSITEGLLNVLGVHTIERTRSSVFFLINPTCSSAPPPMSLCYLINWSKLDSALPSSTHILHLFNSDNFIWWSQAFFYTFSLKGVCKHSSPHGVQS